MSTPDSSTFRIDGCRTSEHGRKVYQTAHDVSATAFGTFGTAILGVSVAVHNTKRV